VFDATWELKGRSAVVTTGTCATLLPGTRFNGAGQMIPAHGHLLYANVTAPGYNGPTAADATYTIGIPDAASLVLYHGSDVADALCFYYDTATQTALTTCSVAYICEGAAIQNPHDNTTDTDTDASLERRPGGAAGNEQDTDDNMADFSVNTSPDPHDLASPPTP
jgi:hypothetical protein